MMPFLILAFISFSWGSLGSPEPTKRTHWDFTATKRDYFLGWWKFQSSMEGRYGYHAKDSGGETVRGVTLQTWRSITGKSRTEFLSMTKNEAQKIAYYYFWLPNAKFQDGRINALVTSAFWGGGGYELVKDLQKILNIEPDGVIGEVTILAANEAGPDLFHKLVNCRSRYLKGCWNYGYFKNGWQKSINFFEEL